MKYCPVTNSTKERLMSPAQSSDSSSKLWVSVFSYVYIFLCICMCVCLYEKVVYVSVYVCNYPHEYFWLHFLQGVSWFHKM